MAEPRQTVNKLITLEESVLVTMAGNPTFVRDFPFLLNLKQLARKRTGCGKCGARKAARRGQIMNNIKQSIVNMSEQKKTSLKKALRAEKIRVRVANAGKVTEYTF